MPRKRERELPEPEEPSEELDSSPDLFPPEGSIGGNASAPYFGGSPVFFEPQFLCHWCGEKKGVGELIGRCVKCNKLLCDECVEYKGRRIYCSDHAPRCFIATATFQSEDAPEVITLRDFRDSVLQPNPIGSILVDFYYQTSPHVALMIDQHSSLRKAFNSLLQPVVRIARLASE